MYSRKTGKPTSGILTLMKEVTWLNAEEALGWGFIDEITEHTTDPVSGILQNLTTSIKKIINSIFTMKQLAFLNSLPHLQEDN